MDDFHKLILSKYSNHLYKNYLSIDLLPDTPDLNSDEGKSQISKFGNELNYNLNRIFGNQDIEILKKCGYIFDIREYRYFVILSDEWKKVKRDIKIDIINEEE